MNKTLRYKCPSCGGSNTYGGDPYPCLRCGYDGRSQLLSDYARFRGGAIVACWECGRGRHEDCERTTADGRGCTCWTCFRRWTD